MPYVGKKATNVVDVSETQSLTVDGDLTVDTDTLVVDSTNNRVGIGTASPNTLTTLSANSGNAILELNRANANTTGAVGAVNFTVSDGHSVANMYAQGDGDNEGAHLVFRTTSAAGENDPYGSNTTERMRIDSSGNVGIGTSSPSAPTGFTTGTILDVANAGTAGDATDNASIRVSSANRHALLQLKAKNTFTSFIYFGDGDDDDVGKIQYDHTSNFMSFTVNTNEAMRIDSSPQILMGKTVANLTTAGNIIAANATSDGSPAYFYMIKTYDGTRNAWLNYHNGTYVGGINMTNTSTSFPTSSDERLKKNIVDAPSAGEKIDAMQVRSFNWKADDSFQEYGLIAQELQSVYDLPVEQHDIEDTYTVDYSKLVPVLLKEIQDLRKRVATLENN